MACCDFWNRIGNNAMLFYGSFLAVATGQGLAWWATWVGGQASECPVYPGRIGPSRGLLLMQREEGIGQVCRILQHHLAPSDS